MTEAAWPWYRLATMACLTALCALLVPTEVLAESHDEDGPAKCEGTSEPGRVDPSPSDPYPLMAAGWGAEIGNGLLFSRWAEDWRGVRQAGSAPSYKAMKIGEGITLTLSGESRLRLDAYSDRNLIAGQSYQQILLRGLIGVDLSFDPGVQLFAEFGTAQVGGHRDLASPNFQNAGVLQQAFMAWRQRDGDQLLGFQLGRQEFSDGPRALLGLNEGASLRRTWNGLRTYYHAPRYRLGAFAFRPTSLSRGLFDDGIDSQAYLMGANASITVTPKGPNTYVEPFWYRTRMPDRSGVPTQDSDRRDTYGVRLWGRVDVFRFDWTLAHQLAHRHANDYASNGVFATQSLELSDKGWRPRVTLHVDQTSAATRVGAPAFSPLFTSSNYIGESQLLGLSNLRYVGPGMNLYPNDNLTLIAEYGLASRRSSDDTVYAAGGRPYSGTRAVNGLIIGHLARASVRWLSARNWEVLAYIEHLEAGEVLLAAHLPSSSYGYVGVTYRY